MRHNTLLYVLTGQKPDGSPWDADSAVFKAMPLVEGHTRDPKAVVRYLLETQLGIDDTHSVRVSSLLDYLKTQENKLNNKTITDLLTLITAMREYQLC